MLSSLLFLRALAADMRLYLQAKDGHEEHCSWCAVGGWLVVCEKCTKVFCDYCIQRNFGEEELQRILDADEWQCFCCNDTVLQPLQDKFSDAVNAMESHSQPTSQ